MCCCCSLREGTIVVAVLNAMHAVSAITFGSIFLSLAQNKYNSSDTDSFKSIYDQGNKTEQNPYTELTVFRGLPLGIGFFSLSIFICLMIGIVKRKANFLIAWLLGGIIWFVLLVIVTILDFIFRSMSTLTFSNLINSVVFIPLWIVVCCYFKELRSVPSADTPEVKQVQFKDNIISEANHNLFCTNKIP